VLKSAPPVRIPGGRVGDLSLKKVSVSSVVNVLKPALLTPFTGIAVVMSSSVSTVASAFRFARRIAWKWLTAKVLKR
jgi:hypothetical protein